MKENQLAQTREDIERHNGHMLASTWLQCARSEGIGGPFMSPGDRSNIDDVNAQIDQMHSEAGILWWLEWVKDRYGPWAPDGR